MYIDDSYELQGKNTFNWQQETTNIKGELHHYGCQVSLCDSTSKTPK